MDEESRSRHTSYGLDKIIGKEPLECHILYDIISIGVFATYGSNKENIHKFLEDIYAAFSSFYRNNLGRIKVSKGLKMNCFYDGFYKQYYIGIRKNFDTNITTSNSQVDVALG